MPPLRLIAVPPCSFSLLPDKDFFDRPATCRFFAKAKRQADEFQQSTGRDSDNPPSCVVGLSQTRPAGTGQFHFFSALKQRLHTNGIVRKWLTAPIAIDEEKKALIYLTKDELKSIYDLPLSGMKEKARDLFLIACYTALRYSDFSKIKKGCIGVTVKGTKVIRLTQQKTLGQVVIPIINEELEVLLKKYDYNVPSLSEQKINDCIKLVCEHVSRTVPSLCKRERTRLTKTERELLDEGKRKFEFDAEGYPVKPR